jgi:ATP-dependent DNA helicase PIF1
MQLTHKQLNIIEKIKTGQNIVITGPGGSGKSRIIKAIDTNKNFKITAMTGAAAVLINGSTLHSFLGIGLGNASEHELLVKISTNKKILKRWKDLEILIIDEISMLSAELFDKINYMAKHVRHNRHPFGGIQLVLSGDFLQLPCIKGNFCFESDTWEECCFEIFNLTKILRQSNPVFQECLNNARHGRLSNDNLKYITTNQSIDELSRIRPTKIFCFNADVDEINNKKLAKIKSLKHKYTADINYTNIYDSSKHKLLFEDISKNCNAQPVLHLAIGAQVMLLVNVFDNLINGSRGVVVDFHTDDTPIVLFKNGITKQIPFHNYEVLDNNKSVIANIWQIPLRLAYAITVHKSQGLTLDSAVVDLRGVFDYGQAYVALSRVRNINGLCLINATCASFRAHPKALAFYESLTEESEESEESEENLADSKKHVREM